jgi:hypothetical protein
VAPNISSYAGGNSNLWANSYNSLGLKDPYQNKEKSKKKVKKMVTASQKFDDDRLEFVSFYTIPTLALGRGYRVAQEKGPIEIKFKDLVSLYQ